MQFNKEKALLQIQSDFGINPKTTSYNSGAVRMTLPELIDRNLAQGFEIEFCRPSVHKRPFIQFCKPSSEKNKYYWERRAYEYGYEWQSL